MKYSEVRALSMHDLYAEFRRADALGVRELIIVVDEQTSKNIALMNRITKASNSTMRKN